MVVAIGMGFVIVGLMAGCASRTYDAVYIDPVGYNYLLTCEMETTPNDREVLFCSLDEERGVW